jgi:hypothetical protein
MKLEPPFQIKVLGSWSVVVGGGKHTGKDVEPSWIKWGLWVQ